MLISELIKELKKYPQDAEVYLGRSDIFGSWVCREVIDDIDIDYCICLVDKE